VTPASYDSDRALTAARADQARHLRQAVEITRLIGGALAVFGGLLIYVLSHEHARAIELAAVSGLMIAPGLLYIVAASFLAARKYWAWVTTTAITALTMLAAVVITILVLRDSRRYGTDPSTFSAATCWLITFAVILHSLHRCLPSIREARHANQTGFNPLLPPTPVVPINQETPANAPAVIHLAPGPEAPPAPRDLPWDGTGTVTLPTSRQDGA